MAHALSSGQLRRDHLVAIGHLRRNLLHIKGWFLSIASFYWKKKWIIFYAIQNFIDTILMFQLHEQIYMQFTEATNYLKNGLGIIQKMKWIIIHAATKIYARFKNFKAVWKPTWKSTWT